MREIKFRKYNKEYKDFIFLESKLGFSLTQSSNVIYDQYVGIKDKNGVEIYEGDIIKYEYNNENYMVEFLNGSYVLRRFCKNTETLYFDEIDYGLEADIIGNIHENKELLDTTD